MAKRLLGLVAGAGLLALLPVGSATAQTEVETPGTGETPIVGEETPGRAVVDKIPKYEKYSDGLYARRVFGTLGPDEDYELEVWGLLVAPARETEPAKLPGAAVLLLRSGRVALVIGDEKRELGLGASVKLAEDQTFSLVNLDPERPASFRAVILRGMR